MNKEKLKLKKKYLFMIIITVLVLIFLCVFLVNKKNILITDTLIISCDENTNLINKYVKKEYISVVNKDIKWEEDIQGKLGKFKGNINYNKKDYAIKLIVIDDKKPVIERNQTVLYNIGDLDTDFTKNLKITDNCSKTFKGNIKGSYDLKKAGKYSLEYIIYDEGGNKASEKFTLIVNNPEKGIIYSVSSKGYIIKTKDGITSVDGVIIVNKTYKISENYEPENMVPFGKTEIIDYVKDAFDKMNAVASKEGLNLTPSTCYRSYSFQKTLYDKYVSEDGIKKADTYSARPGHSEHHTGLAIDLSPVSDAFEKTPESDWIKENAYKYGFIIRYQKGKEDETGYKYEPWHLRYVGENLSKKLYNGDGTFETLESYFGLTSKY